MGSRKSAETHTSSLDLLCVRRENEGYQPAPSARPHSTVGFSVVWFSVPGPGTVNLPFCSLVVVSAQDHAFKTSLTPGWYLILPFIFPTPQCGFLESQDAMCKHIVEQKRCRSVPYCFRLKEGDTQGRHLLWTLSMVT